MNHTSDEHPWFVESRSSRDNDKADWYMWSDDNSRFSGVRVIFCDVEPSNWTFDPQRGQYYWHRFYHQQPDLNYDNAEVQEAMLSVVRFWLDLGLDGFRLDAVTYLYKAEGTNCESLPQTHKFLKRVRAEIDAAFPNRVLLAEVNQWPDVVTEYFGDGDECHMCFNFPLMPRMFMAVRREQRFPITEILAQTPAIPDGLPVGDLPAQPRRAHLGDGDRRGARLHVRRVRPRPEDAQEPRHPPAPGPPRRQRPPCRRAPLRAAAVAARQPRALLRRRAAHGRQHLPRRP